MMHAMCFLLLTVGGGKLAPFSGSLSAAGFSHPIHLGPVTSIDEAPPEMGAPRPFGNLLASGSLDYTETQLLAVGLVLDQSKTSWHRTGARSTDVKGAMRGGLGFLATLLRARLGERDPPIGANESFAVSELRFGRHDEKSEMSNIWTNTNFREDHASLQLSGKLRVFEVSAATVRKGRRK